MKKTSTVLIFILALTAAVSAAAFLLGRELLPEPEEIGLSHTEEPMGEQAENEALSCTELTVIVENAEDLAALDQYENLKKLNLTGSTCYGDIADYVKSHPQVSVTYAVLLEGEGEPLQLEPGISEITIDSRTYIDSLSLNAKYLDNLQTVVLTEAPESPAELKRLREGCGDAEVLFEICTGAERMSPDAEELNLCGLTPDRLPSALPFLPLMKNVSAVTLTDENGENLLQLPEVAAIRRELPNASLDYRFTLFGVPATAESETLEFYGNSTGYLYDAGLDELESLLPHLPKLKSLYFEFCEIDYDRLAQFREDHPELNIAWRITFGPYSCRTDVEKIYADGSLTTEKCYNLRYCTKVKYIDLGHNPGLTGIEFAASMPDLEIAIFAAGGLSDVSPLANCKKLRYLEIFTTSVRDLSPLSECTALEHLNISYLPVRDLSPLYGLTNLKRLWCTFCNAPVQQRKEIQELLPNCSFCFDNVEPTGKGWRFNKDGSRVEPYEELFQIFDYDNWRESATYW